MRDLRWIGIAVFLAFVACSEPYGTVAGVAVDTEGKPVFNAAVTLQCPTAEAGGKVLATATTDRAGTFRMSYFPDIPASCRVSIHRKGYVDLTIPRIGVAYNPPNDPAEWPRLVLQAD